ncbi:hypothetical protein LZP69_12690 [Shewanella sp. AS1]|uniref:hypothetical protein n=1 Tax=Shewanella sp. AS1 TaxID=2907626 RepID=UPI001F1F52A1|nr:hypothetical protein [Shewanella sp. AS1]MCE9680022.1 hypothetical protein [Shewanella sp. AS1]
MKLTNLILTAMVGLAFSSLFTITHAADEAHQTVAQENREAITIDPVTQEMKYADVPPAPCQTGGCSETRSSTFETLTEYVTLTLVFSYFDGEFISVNATNTKHPK